MDTRVVLFVALAAAIFTVTTQESTVTPGTDASAATSAAPIGSPTMRTTQETGASGASTNAPATSAEPTTAPPAPATETSAKAPTTKEGTSPPTKRPTVKPASTLSPSAAPSTGGFNAASFVGGIVLGMAIVVIAGFSYTFYKTRRDKNYHTL